MKMAYILFAVGLVCIIAGIILYSNPSKVSESKDIDIVSQEEAKAEKVSLPSELSDTSNSNDNDDCHKKGLEFEEYVVSRFSRKYFSLNEWRGDKFSNDVYPESNTYPDLEFTFTLREYSCTFAVECKWRAEFNSQNKVKWSYKEQLARYRQFAKDKNIPVFIIIGIGGSPSKPSEIFVIPLASIKYVELSKSWLENYRHDPTKNMFFDVPTKTLR